MKDTIIKLFILEPDDMSTFEVVSTDYSIFVLITLKRRFQRCPNCGNSTKVVHNYRKRTIAHPVINGIEATIVFIQRRYRCTNCNHSFSEASPFSLHGRRISKYAVIRLFDKYAGITPISMPTCLCIDEVYAIKYKQRVYACVLLDMLSNQIYDLLPTIFRLPPLMWYLGVFYHNDLHLVEI